MGKVKIVKASAGSGKTYNLALEYIVRVLEEPTLYRHILAVTFTNKATEEMKGRILKNLNAIMNDDEKEQDFFNDVQQVTNFSREKIRERAAEALNLILHDYDSFAVMTIDKFFQRILRSFVREVGVDVNFNLELKTDTLRELATDRLIEDLANNSELREWVFDYLQERRDREASLDLKKDILELSRRLFTEEYRGVKTGERPKESLITLRKSAYAEIEKRKAAQQPQAEKIGTMLEREGISFGDIYSAVANYITNAANGESPKENASVVKAYREEQWLKKSAKKSLSNPDGLSVELGKLIDLVRDTQKAINTASLIEKHYRTYALIIALSKHIDSVCIEDNLLPISEVTNIIAELVKENDAPFIFEKVGNRYSHFMIDEFQDTSSVQWGNFLPLLHNALSQSEATPVLLVGDVKQSIYRWRGGDWSLLGREAQKEFREIEESPLDTNYRSRQEIVRFNNSFFNSYKRNINSRVNTLLKTGIDSGNITQEWAEEYKDIILNAYKGDSQRCNSQKRGYVTTTFCALATTKYTLEEHPIIKRVIDLQERGFSASDIAILVRNNSDATFIAEILLRYKALHPESPYTFDVITQVALKIGASDICKQVIAVMKYALSPKDNLSEALLKRACGYDLMSSLPEGEKSFFQRLRSLPLQEAFEEIVLHYNLDKRIEDHAYLQALHEQVIRFSKQRIADLALFVEWWEELGCDESITMPSGARAITVATIHKSKGLAFGVVILNDCNWVQSIDLHRPPYLWPKLDAKEGELSHFLIKYTKDTVDTKFCKEAYKEQVQSYIDNINLLYVALTRAKYEMHLIVIPSVREREHKLGVVIEQSLQEMVENGRNPKTELDIDIKCSTLPKPERSIEELIKSGVAEEGLNDEMLYEYGTPINRNAELIEEAAEQAKRMEPATEEDRERLNYSEIGFDTTLPWEKMRIKYSAERHLDEVESAKLHPLNMGIMLHKLFSESDTAEDIFRGLELAELEGTISRSEGVELKSRIESAFTNPQIAGWFDGSWSVIRNEHQILRPDSRGNRPDRAMFSERQTVVVDYKFGRNQIAQHNKQVREYMELLDSMGYKNIEGYIWYVTLGEVVEVSRD